VSQSKPAQPDPKEIAGRYEVVKRLGAGAFGTVYKARDRELGRYVAIKTIRLEGLAASVASLEELLKRFRVEARNAANLKHPNIVTIYDINEVEGLCYLAMEYIDGVGLDRILSDSGKVPVGRAATLVAQVADALGYAHKHKVIHRDIKPANIMVEAGDQVKLTDFGIAKATDSGEHLTMTGSLLGTPSYMSPEQARASSELDGRSDLFALGCVFYELLTGKKAFRGDSITAVLFKVVAEEPVPIAELDPTIPEEAIRIVGKALAKAPEKRYQTGQELAEDLRALAHPGSSPTIRQSDAPGDYPTISFDATAPGTEVTPPTVATPGTLASSPTVARPTTPPPPPPLPTPVAKPPQPPPATPRVPRAAPPATPRRSGGGAGLLVGLAAGGLLLILLVGAGAWWLLGRRTPAPPETPVESASAPSTTGGTAPAIEPTTAPAEAPESAPAEAPASVPAVATPPPASAAPTRTVTTPPPPVTTPNARASASAPAPPATTTTPAGAPAAPAAAASDAFLDTIPPDDSPDGRALAAELSRSFSSSGSGSSSFGSSRNHRRRTVIPPHSAAERPAVRTLAWILTAEKAHHRRTGRFGSFEELVHGRDLPLGSASGDGFERAGYRFTVKVTDAGFRADALPRTPDGRAFYVDEAGYVLPDD